MKNIRGFWFLVAGLFLLTACRGESAERLWIKAPDWSRAQAIGGMGIPDPAPFVLDEAGNIYFLFIDGDLEALQAQVVAFTAQGERIWAVTFDEILKLPDVPQIVWDGEMLHGFWINSGALIATRLDRNGTVLQEPAVISGDVRVDSYSAVASNEGDIAVWFAASPRDAGLYQADLSLVDEPTLIDEEGVFPSLRFDQAGTLHAAWAHASNNNPQVQFLYAAYADIANIAGSGSVVQETRVPLTADMVGPTLGLDGDEAYIYWVLIFRTGLEAGFTETRFISFSQSNPGQPPSAQQFFIPAEHDLDYQPFPEESLHVGDRYSLAERPSPSVGVFQDITTNVVQEGELAVAFRAAVNYYWRRASNQIGVVYIQDGLPTSYQLLSFTQQPSTDPTVISDANGDLYVSWLERGDVSRFDVFLTSTSDGLKDAFNSVTAGDITNLSAATIFGLLTGVLLAPLAAVLFLVLPLIVIGLTAIFRRGEQTLKSPGTIISFILAIAVFQVAKVGALPDLLTYVPFSAWLPLPNLLKAPLQLIVPLVIMIVAIFSAWHFTYRRRTDSPLYFMILYVAVDTLFTMAIYGVLFYGAF